MFPRDFNIQDVQEGHSSGTAEQEAKISEDENRSKH
jgi:hypothetical protein